MRRFVRINTDPFSGYLANEERGGGCVGHLVREGRVEGEACGGGEDEGNQG